MNHDQNSRLIGRLQIDNRTEKDERTRLFLSPNRIVWLTDSPGCSVKNSQVLLENKSKQIPLCGSGGCVLSNHGGNAAIVLDFGQELHGGLEFSVHKITGAKNASLRIRFGESVTETMSELGGTTNATNDHARRDLTVTVQELSMNPVGETGFRFVRIDLLTPDVSISFNTIKAVMIFRDIPYLGSFSCDDPLLNRIWDVGAYTVHLNMQQYIWDGIKRDRLVWIGDLHPEIATIQTVFGNHKIIQDSLDFVVSETPPGKWMNNIPSYSMWWIIIQHDYFMQFGDRDYLQKQIPYMKNVCQMLSMHIDENGKDSTPPMRFVDWPTKENADATDVGLQALHTLANQYAMEIFTMLGETEMAHQCKVDAQKLQAWPVHLADAKQANALAVIAELLNAKQANEMSLKCGGAEGLSAFMGYYILLARAQAGDVAGALDTIRQYWGGMLKLGATTFWEDFDIHWMENAAPIDRLPKEHEIDVHGTYGKHCYKGFRHSLCHGWASGPTSWLTRYVLGVEIIEPGCRKIRIRPNLCDLKWVKGTYPTPEGIIEIEHRMQEDGAIKTVVRAPKGIQVFCEECEVL